MLQPTSATAAGSDALSQLDQLLQRAQRKVGEVNGADQNQAAPAEQAAATEEMDFANPEVLNQFLGQVTSAQEETSPFQFHSLDAERVARLLAE